MVGPAVRSLGETAVLQGLSATVGTPLEGIGTLPSAGDPCLELDGEQVIGHTGEGRRVLRIVLRNVGTRRLALSDPSDVSTPRSYYRDAAVENHFRLEGAPRTSLPALLDAREWLLPGEVVSGLLTFGTPVLPPEQVDRQFVELPVEPTSQTPTGSLEWDLGSGAMDESLPSDRTVPAWALLATDPVVTGDRDRWPECYCGSCGHDVADRSPPAHCPQCGARLFA
jgi:hypothetical protein